ncbi:hypothetical protein FBQ99_11735 [Chloroflexi bacterium CFX2]|nr:hypothetical protein [Chloroflexi bacterium CFX2]
MKRTVFIWLTFVGIALLIIGLSVGYKLFISPLPISLDDPKAQPIKSVLAHSHKIEAILFCLPESDINLLNEVYKDTSDYKLNQDIRVMVSKYLGEDSLNKAGYLTYKKAYFLWSRSGDPYPKASPDPTLEYLTAITPKPIRYCPNPLKEPELRYQSISIRDNKAIVDYGYGAYHLVATLRKFDNSWFIVNSRAISVNP